MRRMGLAAGVVVVVRGCCSGMFGRGRVWMLNEIDRHQRIAGQRPAVGEVFVVVVVGVGRAGLKGSALRAFGG